MYELRDYQKSAVSAGVYYIKNSKKPTILQACTSAGKSLILANICKTLNEKILVFQPNVEILEQNVEKYESYGFKASIFSASKNRKETTESVIFATIQSVYKYPELFKDVKYCIVDECHLINPKNIESMYMTFFKAIDCKHILGLTATPYRIVNKFCVDGKEKIYTGCLSMLNRIYPFFFSSIIYKIELKDLMRQGYILKPEYVDYSNGYDLNQLKINSTGCDYTDESVKKYNTKKDRLENVIKAVKEFYEKKNKILIFCSCKDQAYQIKELLENNNFKPLLVFGDTTKDERSKIINIFKNNEKQILINVACLTTGFDCPSLDCVILARQIMSPTLYFQIIGRLVRYHKDKKPVFVDCTKTFNKLGRAEDYILAKEDGFKDCLINESSKEIITGKILFKYQIKRDKQNEI